MESVQPRIYAVALVIKLRDFNVRNTYSIFKLFYFKDGCIFDENCNEEDIIRFMDVSNDSLSKRRNEKKIKDKLKLAMKHLLHNTKQRRIDFTEIELS